MKRHSMSRGKSSKYFKRTSGHHFKNNQVTPMRGGFRL